jgi:IS30 family transposase
VKSINSLERKWGKWFKHIFKSITMDNGSEFSDVRGVLKSCVLVGNRTDTYYCHPYSAYERRSNENANIMIRRWFPKGTDFSKISRREIRDMEAWLNDYPRKIHGWKSANELFDEEVRRIKAAA